ncbi:MAG: hypothetical protein QOH80_127 [Actinomycetota bacterium]|nr:hypothetical protein [Actinomycetota bacterium]
MATITATTASVSGVNREARSSWVAVQALSRKGALVLTGWNS